MTDDDAHIAAFRALSHQQQSEAIARLAACGWSARAIAEVTELSIEQVERLLRPSGSGDPLEVIEVSPGGEPLEVSPGGDPIEVSR